MEDLKDDSTDRIVAILKGALGALPVAGSLFAEALTIWVPNQRMDRVVQYLEQVELNVRFLEKELLWSRMVNPERLELFNAGVLHTSKSVSDERIKYFATMAARALTEEEVNFSEEMHFMRMLSELTDVEVVLLKKYAENAQMKRAGQLIPKPLIDRNEEPINTRAINESYLNHMASLGLLRKNQARGDYVIVYLGTILLERIGLKFLI